MIYDQKLSCRVGDFSMTTEFHCDTIFCPLHKRFFSLQVIKVGGNVGKKLNIYVYIFQERKK